MTLTCNRSLRTVTNFFICNLAVSDMLFTMSGPVIGACRITQSWTMGHCACITIVYLEFVSGSVSIWTMVMISVERFICIVKCSTSTFTPRIAVLKVIKTVFGLVIIFAIMWLPIFTN
ncbi:free fatty acid receptor 4-like [Patella vulgata]|uniref:free fatty acid receptor 4-like n=1 Tax=Patella vulgata TaxID=6465 RepID=UPI0024A7DFFB|nr:free fatty acid receptor 4-like [Patella vulgata]